MAEVILQEKRWIEEAMERGELGNRPAEMLARMGRYYYSQGYKKAEISKMLETYLLRCEPETNIVKWQPVITRCAKNACKYALIDIPPVKITDAELAKIRELQGTLKQRLMFTLLCLAKYGNAVNPKNNSWVNLDAREIMSMANIKLTFKRQSLLFNDLWTDGYIGYSNIVDNINVDVLIADDSEGEAEMLIDDFRSLGNQYMMHEGGGYMKCKSCGVVVKRTSPNQKYCQDCAVEVNIQKTMENRTKVVA